ncbi:zinc ribbon domain-containing protein [Halobaculum limi]|uniref:zinc ribbon domain-containing protein n=1 Tax=Halobaculum limi TaxID=3031916 RepID=UPI002406EF37|nr:zinc ribbon domain-containing protein [Halobaculum sp. YSMS11]
MNLPRVLRPSGPKRPWLAALLALVVTGLGHAYLRRWLRGFGWFAATFAAIVLLVPPEVVEAINTGGTIANPVDALPPVFVVVASAVDAYLLARETQRDARATRAATMTAEAGATDRATDRASDDAERGVVGDVAPDQLSDEADAPSCPACGKELDPDLDFCPWCTTKLDRAGPNGDGGSTDQ